MKHVAASLSIGSDGTVISLCSCGKAFAIEKHRYTYPPAGIEFASDALMKHIYDMRPAVNSGADE